MGVIFVTYSFLYKKGINMGRPKLGNLPCGCPASYPGLVVTLPGDHRLCRVHMVLARQGATETGWAMVRFSDLEQYVDRKSVVTDSAISGRRKVVVVKKGLGGCPGCGGTMGREKYECPECKRVLCAERCIPARDVVCVHCED